MARFKDDKPIRCGQCNRLIYAGEHYIEYDGCTLCDEACLKDMLLEDADYEEKYLETSEDKEADYGDYLHDCMRDDEMMEGE